MLNSRKNIKQVFTQCKEPQFIKTSLIPLILICLISYVLATTTITDNLIETTDLTVTGTVLNISSLDSVVRLYGNSSMLDGNPASGGIEINQTVAEAKAGIWWNGWDQATQTNRPVAWMVAHFNSSTGGAYHSHWSVETLDNTTGTPSINTHFYIDYGGNLTKSEVGVSSADFIVGDIAEFNTTGKIKLLPITHLEIYPNNQSSISLRITEDGTAVNLQGLGTSSIKFLDNVDLGNKYLNNTRLEDSSGQACTGTEEGQIAYDYSSHKAVVCNSTSWIELW